MRNALELLAGFRFEKVVHSQQQEGASEGPAAQGSETLRCLAPKLLASKKWRQFSSLSH
jgi:hypothetical protein